MAATSTLQADERGFDASALRRALGAFPTGVTVMTTRSAAGDPVGMTATSFNSLSLDPPLVLWSIGNGSSSLEAFAHAAHWAVHVLAREQHELASRFSQRSADRFADLPLEEGLHGLPLLRGCAARFECSAFAVHPAGDHSLLIGEVLRLAHAPVEPLVFHASQYWSSRSSIR